MEFALKVREAWHEALFLRMGELTDAWNGSLGDSEALAGRWSETRCLPEWAGKDTRGRS